MKQLEILDDLEEIDGLNGSWHEWWRGLAIGIGVQFILHISEFKVLDTWYSNHGRYVFHFEFFGYKWNFTGLVFSVFTFISLFSFLFFSFSWKQPYYRIFILGFVASIIKAFSVIIQGVNYGNPIAPYSVKIIDLFAIALIFFILFSFTSFLFKKGYRLIGIILLIIIFIWTNSP